MKRMRYLLLILIIIITGCSSPKPTDWYKPNTTQQQLEQDFAYCHLLSEINSTPYESYRPGGLLVHAMSDKSRSILNDCMESKGYTRLGKTAQRPTNKPTALSKNGSKDDLSIESSLIGYWEGESRQATEATNITVKIDFLFQPNNKLVLTTTAIRDGKTEKGSADGSYAIRGDKIYFAELDGTGSEAMNFENNGDHLTIYMPAPAGKSAFTKLSH